MPRGIISNTWRERVPNATKYWENWQPESSFVDPEAVNEVYLTFEFWYPRYLGNVCLLPYRAAVYHLNRTFPFAEYGLAIEEPEYNVRARFQECPSAGADHPSA